MKSKGRLRHWRRRLLCALRFAVLEGHLYVQVWDDDANWALVCRLCEHAEFHQSHLVEGTSLRSMVPEIGYPSPAATVPSKWVPSVLCALRDLRAGKAPEWLQ